MTSPVVDSSVGFALESVLGRINVEETVVTVCVWLVTIEVGSLVVDIKNTGRVVVDEGQRALAATFCT